MFDDTMIVQSAVSAFNNAALSAPAFFWWAFLSIPLFGMVYFYGKNFVERFGWSVRNIKSKIPLTVVLFVFAWLILFGGNYGVLRDNVTILPFMIAAIVFVASIYVGSNFNQLNLPKLRSATKKQKLRIISVWILFFMVIGLSDFHAWWGPLLQMGAFAAGLLIGRKAKNEMRPLAGTSLIIFATTVAILMQPEFFRFGQLGSLSAIHLIFLIAIALVTAAVIALRNVKPKSFIRHSAFVKLKWLARFLSALCVALFVLTESVPIFLGMTVMLFVTFVLSIVHSEKIQEHLDEKLFAILLCLFGIITTMPVITALGIVYWTYLPNVNVWQQSKFLL